MTPHGGSPPYDPSRAVGFIGYGAIHFRRHQLADYMTYREYYNHKCYNPLYHKVVELAEAGYRLFVTEAVQGMAEDFAVAVDSLRWYYPVELILLSSRLWKRTRREPPGWYRDMEKKADQVVLVRRRTGAREQQVNVAVDWLSQSAVLLTCRIPGFPPFPEAERAVLKSMLPITITPDDSAGE